MNFIKFLWGVLINLEFYIYFCISILLLLAIVNKKYQKCAFKMVSVGTFMLVLIAYLPISLILTRNLENRFDKATGEEIVAEDVAGFIFLGGTFEQSTSINRTDIVYNISGGRFIAFMELMKKYPDKYFVFTGTKTEINLSSIILKNLQFDINNPKLLLLSNALNTVDNSKNTYKDLISIDPSLLKKKWIIVTSAFHMARSIGIFEKDGWKVLAYPVDYYTSKSFSISDITKVSSSKKSALWTLSIKEWAGLINNYFEGYSNKIYPDNSILSITNE